MNFLTRRPHLLVLIIKMTCRSIRRVLPREKDTVQIDIRSTCVHFHSHSCWLSTWWGNKLGKFYGSYLCVISGTGFLDWCAEHCPPSHVLLRWWIKTVQLGVILYHERPLWMVRIEERNEMRIPSLVWMMNKLYENLWEMKRWRFFIGPFCFSPFLTVQSGKKFPQISKGHARG